MVLCRFQTDKSEDQHPSTKTFNLSKESFPDIFVTRKKKRKPLVVVPMTDTIKTLKQVRDVIQNLTECRGFVIDKQKKKELDQLLRELRILEDSLLVKDPLTSLQLGINVPIPNTPSMGLPAASRHAPSINQFRVFADQQNLTSIPRIREAARSRGIDPREAVESVTYMNQSRQRAEIQAWASNLFPDIRAKLFGRHVTPSEAKLEVSRLVQASNIESRLVEPVTHIITQQLVNEATGNL